MDLDFFVKIWNVCLVMDLICWDVLKHILGYGNEIAIKHLLGYEIYFLHYILSNVCKKRFSSIWAVEDILKMSTCIWSAHEIHQLYLTHLLGYGILLRFHGILVRNVCFISSFQAPGTLGCRVKYFSSRMMVLFWMVLQLCRSH